jgi:hypothetical protein
MRWGVREGYVEIGWLVLAPDRPSETPSGIVTASFLMANPPARSHDTCRVAEHQLMSGEMGTFLRINLIAFTPTSSKSTSSSDGSESFSSPSFSDNSFEVAHFSGDVMTSPMAQRRRRVWGQEGVNGYGSSGRKRHAQNTPLRQFRLNC